MMMSPNGTLVEVEVYGPGSFLEWSASYKVFRVLAIALNVISPARLDAYYAKIEELSRLYPDCWALIYQADVRSRKEHAGRIKYKLALKFDYYTKNGWQAHEVYDPTRPWEYVFHSLASREKEWWEKQVETPCWRINMKLASMGQFLGGDALTTTTMGALTSAGPRNPFPGTQRTETVPYRGKRTAEDTPPLTNKRLALTDAPPVPTTPLSTGVDRPLLSRKGKEICKGFNAGTCMHMNGNGYCSADGSSLHICSICRKAGHSAQNHDEATAAPAVTGGQPKGGGKGKKNRRRGKGGGKNRWEQ